VSPYSQVVLDVDSTLSCIEGIDWLAHRCGSAVSEKISEMTAAAMRGDIPLESVYESRLACVQPTRADITALADAYIAATSPGAREAITLLVSAGVRVIVVSGGLRDAILPLARHVGIAPSDVHAVALRFADNGDYLGYDTSSPLWRMGGKPNVVGSLAGARTTVAVGDGITDAELKPVVAKFIAFTGVVRNERVVATADAVITRFSDLPPLVLS
jgi:phosphoserine phosphatase